MGILVFVSFRLGSSGSEVRASAPSWIIFLDELVVGMK